MNQSNWVPDEVRLDRPVEPRLFSIPLWRPESEDDLLVDQPARSNGYAAVGRKP